MRFGTVDEEAEGSSLLGGGIKPKRSAFYNFMVLCVGFGSNNACIIVALSYVTSQFGIKLGSYAIGYQNMGVTVGSLFLAVPAMDFMGTVRAINLSIIGNLTMLICLYVASTLDRGSSSETVAVSTGAAICGLASGTLVVIFATCSFVILFLTLTSRLKSL